jgi:predicted transposase/invertase (TIGR01784 family)
MSLEILPPTNDWVFKLLFGDERNKDLLIALLKSFMELPQEEYEITFMDTNLKPEALKDKLGIVDVKVKTKSGKIIDIEIQVNPIKDIGKRISFYKSKLVAGQIGEGEPYKVIQKVFCICITNYVLFPEVKDYLNSFRYYNRKNGFLFEAIPEEVVTMELPKVPREDDKSGIWDWLQFLRSEVKEEFDMIGEKNPEVKRAVETLYSLSGNEQVRAEYEMRQKALRDIASQNDDFYQDGIQKGLVKGREEGREEGREALLETARKLREMGLSMEQISAATGLSSDAL